MALILPITLLGHNLGDRHRFLNSQVNQAAAGQVAFQDIESLAEHTAVDRLIKIDIAIKLNNADYLLKNLKDDDILYVSRALKCKWLIERRDIINPNYLEEALFPQMVLPAITKFKHWLYINLTDPVRCQEFYEFYKKKKFDFAIKFLSHCDNEYLLNEFPDILTKINPHYLKVLGEKCPKLIKIYYDSLSTNMELVKRYLKNEQDFYKNIKFLLKADPDVFLDITEKFHSLRETSKLSSVATKYILRHHKSRFMAKSELYIAHLLHMPTVAQCLSVEECQEQVLKLARAEYLSWWFLYPNVEPLVKRVPRESRAAFKKKVFVEKDIGERVAEWPYTLPASPVTKDTQFLHVFSDSEYESLEIGNSYGFQRVIRNRDLYSSSSKKSGFIQRKSELEKLYDEFRFVGFDDCLLELRDRINAVTSADRRRDILLVLVSKSGGRPECVRSMLQLALRLRNEPVHERAAIVRSLVKRASAWRLPQDVWDSMLEYGHGLGLDGTEPEAQCREGIHAVVLRQLLTSRDCIGPIRSAFLEDFSTLEEYKLNSAEKETVTVCLQRILMSAANDANPEDAANYLNLLLDVFEKYRVPFQSALSAVKALSDRNSDVVNSLLQRLYNARVHRRELFHQYLTFKHDDAALLNVLRHDPSALKSEWLVKLLLDGETRANQCFSKMAVYFNERNGLTEQMRSILLSKVVESVEAADVKLARPLATLAGKSIQSIVEKIKRLGKKRRSFAGALRANMHQARPAPNALDLGWRKAGLKALAWRATRCRPSEVTQVVQTLLEDRVKRTVRLALVLAQRTSCAADIYSTAVTIKPLAALRAALPYYRILGESADLRIFEIVKPYIANLDPFYNRDLIKILKNYDWVPNTIKPEYCAILYLLLNEISDSDDENVRRYLMKCLPQVRDDLVKNVLTQMLSQIGKSLPKLCPALVIRYLMLSKNEDEEKCRFEQIGQPFLKKITLYRESGSHTYGGWFFKVNFEQIITSLQYNTAFFDDNYSCCLVVIERVLNWMSNMFSKETHLEEYIKIHATMLYFKAIRQSMEKKPEIFTDPSKKLTEGVDIVGFTFGRYIIKEVVELKSKYFDSIIELYSNALADYLDDYFVGSPSTGKFIAALIRGILSESVGSEARLAVHVLQTCFYNVEISDLKELKDLCSKREEKEVLFFMYAEMFET